MSPEARDHSFDELTRGLASGSISRGKALKLMGATLVGGALASIPGIAWAKPNKPAGAKCNHNHQCASGQCVEGPVGRVCGGGCSSCPAPCECVDPVGGGQQACVEPCSVAPCQLVDACATCTDTGRICEETGLPAPFPPFQCRLPCI